MEAEIAPSYKFKLAVNRGLPYLIPHGLSGELLPHRCTIAIKIAFFFSVALSSPSRALGFPKQICYLDCPDFPHLYSPRTAVLGSLDIGYGLRARHRLIAAAVALRTPMPSSSLAKNGSSRLARFRRVC